MFVDPLLIDTQMKKLKLKWNMNGSLLAISGTQSVRTAAGEEKEISVVQIYTPFGKFLKSLKVPGKGISSLSWEQTGLRLALAVDSFLYFAQLRPDYLTTYFASCVLVYYAPFKNESKALYFWNVKTKELIVR